MGSTAGDSSSLAARSPSSSSAAPPRAEAGIRKGWSAPVKRRSMWGATSPTKLTTPTKATLTAAMRVHSAMLAQVRTPTLTPRLRAVSPPPERAL